MNTFIRFKSNSDRVIWLLILDPRWIWARSKIALTRSSSDGSQSGGVWANASEVDEWSSSSRGEKIQVDERGRPGLRLVSDVEGGGGRNVEVAFR